MLRLAILGAEEASWSGVAPRLRGATLAAILAGVRGQVPPKACDAVVVVSPLRIDQETIERCLGAGKHVLFAAEPCWSKDALKALGGKAQQGGVQLAIVNPDHYLPSRQLLRQQVGGNLGAAGLLRLHRWEPAAADPGPQFLGLPCPLVRDLELALWLIGQPPNRVHAIEQRTQKRGDAAGRYVQVHLGFPGGGMALIDHARCLPPGDGYQALTVIGSSGAAYADDQQNMQLLYRGGRPQAVRTEETARQGAALVQDFVEALNTGRDLSASLAAWQEVCGVADAVQQALATKRAVALEGR